MVIWRRRRCCTAAASTRSAASTDAAAAAAAAAPAAYPGKIKRDNRDGTFDALVDDGDRDPMVPEQSIRKPGGESGVAGNDDEVTRGGEVEARCKGSVKYLLSWYDQA